MKITVFFTSGIVIEVPDVNDRRRVCRLVSKQCKHITRQMNAACYYPINFKERVEALYFDDKLMKGGEEI